MGEHYLKSSSQKTKMPNKTYLILCFGLCLALGANSAPQRSKINTEEEEEKVAEIKKFHVNSKIQLRYAITDVATQMQKKYSLICTSLKKLLYLTLRWILKEKHIRLQSKQKKLQRKSMKIAQTLLVYSRVFHSQNLQMENR